MKRLLYWLAGALLGLVAGSAVAYVFNSWYAARYIRGDEDFNFLTGLLILGFWPGGLILGIVAAHMLYRRSRAR